VLASVVKEIDREGDRSEGVGRARFVVLVSSSDGNASGKIIQHVYVYNCKIEHDQHYC